MMRKNISYILIFSFFYTDDEYQRLVMTYDNNNHKSLPDVDTYVDTEPDELNFF